MRFDSSIEQMKADIIKTTQELISFKSVEGMPERGAPFGRETRACLDRALEMCEEMGFKTKNVDGYAGHAEAGEGDEIIGILVHLDVVPEGTDWSVDPYGGEIKDGKLFGRGSIDDKGPAAAAMYALKAVKDAGTKFNKRVRIIFGCDEESGRWDCMKHYFANEEMPSCGFSPDADFPIINSEKGITIFKLSRKFVSAEITGEASVKIKSFKGGSRPNTVPDYCECLLEVPKELQERVQKTANDMKEELHINMELAFEGERCTAKVHGISAHGSTPEKGINAIAQMAAFLCKLPLTMGEQVDFVNFVDSCMGRETDGRSFGLYMEDEVSGKLVFNLGVLEVDEEQASAMINVRYPVTKTRDEVYAVIEKKAAEEGLEYEEVAGKPPLYVPADNFLVQTLQGVYERVTGEKATLISIGGGTYSRAIKNAVAFGPLFPGQEELAHQKDEFIGIEDLLKCAKIYAEAICELVK
jgi:succinyl-diaminopimelate desuccinylase